MHATGGGGTVPLVGATKGILMRRASPTTRETKAPPLGHRGRAVTQHKQSNDSKRESILYSGESLILQSVPGITICGAHGVLIAADKLPNKGGPVSQRRQEEPRNPG